MDDEEEQRERKLSSRRANLWRVRLLETEMLVEEGSASIMSITALHLCLANSTASASAIVGVHWRSRIFIAKNINVPNFIKMP